MKVYEQLEIELLQCDGVDVICASDNFTGTWADPNEETEIGKF